MNEIDFRDPFPNSGEGKTPLLPRIFAVISFVAASDRPVTISEITGHLNIPKASAHRACRMLQDADILRRDPLTKGFCPGFKLHCIALDTVLSTSFAAARRATLRHVVEACSETCTLTAQDGDQLLVLERVESPSPVQVNLRAGSRVPLHCTAGGKLFVAFMRAPWRERLIQNLDLVAYTVKTITDRVLLDEQIQRVRKQKYAIDNEEFAPGLIGIAVPVLDEHGRIKAAISINAPSHRVPAEGLEQWLPPLRKAATALSDLIDS